MAIEIGNVSAKNFKDVFRLDLTWSWFVLILKYSRMVTYWFSTTCNMRKLGVANSSETVQMKKIIMRDTYLDWRALKNGREQNESVKQVSNIKDLMNCQLW